MKITKLNISKRRWIKTYIVIYQNNFPQYQLWEDGYWIRRDYDQNYNMVYFQDSMYGWTKTEYDEYNNEIYRESSTHGILMDNRNFNLEK